MSPRPDILIIAHCVPFPLDSDERIRIYHLIKHLSQYSSVHLACLTNQVVSPGAMGVLNGICKRVATIELSGDPWLRGLTSIFKGKSYSEGVFHSKPFRNTVRAWAADTPFRAAIATSFEVSPYCWTGKLVKVPAIVDLVDMASQKWFDAAIGSWFPRSRLRMLEGRRVHLAETGIANWARTVTLASKEDVAIFRQCIPSGSFRVATSGVDLDYFVPPATPQDGNGCVFIGPMDHRPNIDAVEWFANEIWRKVLEAHPNATFRIVGRNPAKEVRRLARMPGIEIIGAVRDDRPYLHDAAIVVAPMQVARGLQRNVLDAMAMAKPVIASPVALGGFQHDVPAIRAESPAEWVEHLVDLLNDPDERWLLGGMCREFVEHNHDWNRCFEPFRDLLGMREKVVEPRIAEEPALVIKAG